MTSAVKRSYPFGSRPTSLVEETDQFKVPQAPLHKKMSMSHSINISVDGAALNMKLSKTITTTMQDNDTTNNVGFMSISNCNNLVATDYNEKSPLLSPLPSPPSAKGRNRKNLQVVVPPVRSSISAPSSPQLPPNVIQNRRPSTPICVYQTKGPIADPRILISKTENAIGEDLPYKDEPIQIMQNLYLGSEINAANRSMLDRLGIEFILNVAKEVDNPYFEDYPYSPSSDCSNDSFHSAIQTPLLDSPMVISSPMGVYRSSSLKRSSMPSRSNSIPAQSIFGNVSLSGIPLTVPATDDFGPLKYKKFFWTHNQENLISDFASAFAFIDEARSTGRNILVHCQCGVSRSASLIIGYVMNANRMTLNQAYEFVKDRSPYICPNMSLVYQLVDFEKTLKLGKNNDVHNPLSDNTIKTKSENTKSRSHSRSSSIESDLLLKTHKRSNSIPRNTTGSISIYDNIPKTPTVISESSLIAQTTQSTVKGVTGRFHVITASVTPTSPIALSPTSSLSPTSTVSPTTPSSEPSPTSQRRSSKPRDSNSSLGSSEKTRSMYSMDFSPLSPKKLINPPMTPSFISSSSLTHTIENFGSQSNFLLPETTPRIIGRRHSNVISSYSSLNGITSSLYARSSSDNIFSPTRISPPITPMAIPNISDLLFRNDQ
ncbi:6659_t:CDS:1, partial [Racocetra persica]